jgi:hypothetical protein
MGLSTMITSDLGSRLMCGGVKSSSLCSMDGVDEMDWGEVGVVVRDGDRKSAQCFRCFLRRGREKSRHQCQRSELERWESTVVEVERGTGGA